MMWYVTLYIKTLTLTLHIHSRFYLFMLRMVLNLFLYNTQ